MKISDKMKQVIAEREAKKQELKEILEDTNQGGTTKVNAYYKKLDDVILGVSNAIKFDHIIYGLYYKTTFERKLGIQFNFSHHIGTTIFAVDIKHMEEVKTAVHGIYGLEIIEPYHHKFMAVADKNIRLRYRHRDICFEIVFTEQLQFEELDAPVIGTANGFFRQGMLH